MVEKDEEKFTAPFPQANDFEKIIKIIKVDRENFLQDNGYLETLLEISDRQVQYYISACVFLGIIDNERLFTEYGSFLRNLGHDQFITYLSMKIISIPVFGDCFFSKFLYDEELTSNEISELLSVFYGIKSSEVAIRRASTVKNWINWIFEQKKVLI